MSLKRPAACSPLAHTDPTALPAPAGHFSSSSSLEITLSCSVGPSMGRSCFLLWSCSTGTPQPTLHHGITLISSSCSPRGKALAVPALARKCHSPESSTAQGYKTAENRPSLGWWSQQALVVVGRSWTQREDPGVRMYVNARQWQIRIFRASL